MLFCGDTGRFGGDIGLLCGDIGLFCGDVWLFCGKLRLWRCEVLRDFVEEMMCRALLRRYRAVFQRYRALLCTAFLDCGNIFTGFRGEFVEEMI